MPFSTTCSGKSLAHLNDWKYLLQSFALTLLKTFSNSPVDEGGLYTLFEQSRVVVEEDISRDDESIRYQSHEVVFAVSVLSATF